jgi:hypothetical protein
MNLLFLACTGKENESMLNFVKLNVKWLAAGIILLLLGFMVMGWNTPGAPDTELQVFAWHKITLAPVMLMAGYVCIGIAVMKRSR